MALLFGQVACPSNAATQIVAAANANVDGSAGGAMGSRSVTLLNLSAWDCYIGDSTVTSAYGYLLKANSTPLTLQLRLGDSVYGHGAANTPVISWIEGSQP